MTNTVTRTTRVRATAHLNRLQPVDDVLNALRAKHEKRHYYQFDDPSMLKLAWDKSKDTYVGTFEGKTLPLSGQALRTGIKFARIPSAEFLVGKPPQRFIENMFDRAKIEHGIQVAVDDKEILGFVDPKFQFMTDYSLIEGTLQGIPKSAIRGIEVAEHHEGDAMEYRVIFGDSIIKPAKKDDIYGMIALTAAEYGLYQNECNLGLWRLICLNGMLSAEKAQQAKWSHRGEKAGNSFMETLCHIIGEANEFGKYMGQRLHRAMELELAAPYAYVIHAMREMKMLRAREEELLQFEGGGSNIENAYGVFNVITDAAKQLDLHKRHNLERTAMNYVGDMERVNKVAQAAFEEGIDLGDNG